MDQWLSRSCHHSFGVSERWLQSSSAAGPPLTWPPLSPSLPLSLSSPDSWLPPPAADRRQVLGLHKRMHALHKHTHLDADAMQPHFCSPPLSTVPPPPSTRLLVCLWCSCSLSGFLSLFLWSLESGRSRSSSWRGTSCGPEWLQRQLVIQHVTTPAPTSYSHRGTHR